MRLLSGLGTPSCEPRRAALARAIAAFSALRITFAAFAARAHAYFLCLHSPIPLHHRYVVSPRLSFIFPPYIASRRSRELSLSSVCGHHIRATLRSSSLFFIPRARARPRDDAALSIPVPAYAFVSGKRVSHSHQLASAGALKIIALRFVSSE